MKICGFSIIFYYWILAIRQCDTVSLNCEYKNDTKTWTSSAFLYTTISGYFCMLKSDSKSAVEVTNLDGLHEEGKSDENVNHLQVDSSLKTFSSIFCQKFINLESIWIKNLKIGSIDEDSLLNCKNLDMIFFDGTKLGIVPEKLISRNSELTQVYILKNDLASLSENFFQNQHKLIKLALFDNQLSFLPSKIFQPLEKLQFLGLRNNKLQVIDPEWFVNLESLKYLSLYGNQILDVPERAFKSLGSLDRLWLHSNKIKTLNPKSFEGLQNVHMLYLSKNELSGLPRDVFAPLENMKLLWLFNNKLTVIHSDSFGTHNQLLEIDIQHNKITAIDKKVIDKTAVNKLNMANNLCCSEDIKNRSEIKEKLQKCINNYRPRSSSTCGKSKIIQERIIGGSQISRASFPWIAALVKTNGDYFGGGTLVTEQKVVTAAHCIQTKGASAPFLLQEFLVVLGFHDLNIKFEPGRSVHAIESFQMHPDWNPYAEKFDADIAVLVLKQRVCFNEYIQPICLINPDSAIDTITDGIVVGLGRSEDRTKLHENIPKVIDTPIIDAAECYVKDYNLARISSLRTFCGGSGNDAGVCNGDSGSGLVVHHDDIYYLRGIVSSSRFTIYGECDVDTYAIYTNMLMFYDWVNGI